MKKQLLGEIIFYLVGEIAQSMRCKMKIRNGFVSNSSSSSFIITNKTDSPLTLLDFVKENPQLVVEFNEEYDWHNFTQEQLIENAKSRDEVFYSGDNLTTYGDEDGDALGNVFDYILRDGGESDNFSWRFYEFNR